MSPEYIYDSIQAGYALDVLQYPLKVISTIFQTSFSGHLFNLFFLFIFFSQYFIYLSLFFHLSFSINISFIYPFCFHSCFSFNLFNLFYFIYLIFFFHLSFQLIFHLSILFFSFIFKSQTNAWHLRS